jgi:hypothetical protein
MSDPGQYLGEFPVDIKSHPVYKTYTQSDWAMTYIAMYGQIDGAHHKAWVLDQVARILLGTPVTVTEARWTNHKPEDRFYVGAPSMSYVNWRKDVMEAPIEGTAPETNDAANFGWDDEGGEYYDEGTPP